MLEKGITAGAKSITNQLIMTGKVDWLTVAVDGVVASASYKVAKEFKVHGMSKTLADGLLGAGAAALRKQNVLAGLYNGVAGSLIAQHAPHVRGMGGAVLNGLVGAGTAALTKQDIAAGFIGGATGSLVGEYMARGFVEAGLDPARSPASAAQMAGIRSGLSKNDLLEQIVVALSTGVAKTVAEWAGRDANVAAMTATAAASKAYNETVVRGDAVSGRKMRMNPMATHLNRTIDQQRADELANREYDFSLKPRGFTAEAQMALAADTLDMFGESAENRDRMLVLLAQAQKPSPVIEVAKLDAGEEAAAADGSQQPGEPTKQVVVHRGARGGIGEVGYFLSEFQNPLSTAGRFGNDVGLLFRKEFPLCQDRCRVT